jgi:hypothetical protein
LSVDIAALRRRVAPAILLTGAALIAGKLLQDAPRDHEIELDFLGSRERFTRAELRLLGPDDEEEAGACWSWPPGEAPTSVRGRVRATPGRWRLRIRLEHAGEIRDIDRSVTLRGEPTQVRIEVEGGGG